MTSEHEEKTGPGPRRPERIRLSIVSPVYNEGEGLREFHRRVSEVVTPLVDSVEFVFVNDGSRDDSLDVLLALRGEDERVKVIDFTRNFGHQTALSAGMVSARGDCVVLMDSDLQDDPAAIPRMMDAWVGGADVVYAVRVRRKESFLKRAAYSLFYRVYQRLASIDVPLDSGDFSLLDRAVVREVNALPERNRFLRGLRSWVGFNQVGLEVERGPRFAGDPKYSVTDLARLALDGLFSFSNTPLRLSSLMGLTVSLVSFLSMGVIFYWKYGLKAIVPGFGTTTIALSVLFIGGVQLLTIGIVGEYLGRVYEEVKRRPLYLVRRSYGLEKATASDQERRLR